MIPFIIRFYVNHYTFVLLWKMLQPQCLLIYFSAFTFLVTENPKRPEVAEEVLATELGDSWFRLLQKKKNR